MKTATVKQLENIIGKLSNLNYRIEGNVLRTAIREVARIRDKVISGELKMRKIK